jgi:hypothetical protein
MNIISKFIRQWRAFRLSLRLLKLIDPKKLEDINDILEEIYPGIKAEIRALVESYDIHATSKTLHYINTHGGIQKMADYYNNADKNGKDVMLSAFNKVFKPGARFEDAVLTLDSIAKQEGLGLYTQLIGDVKDSIVVTSIKQSYRTVEDWRTFVRRQHEANKDVLLGVLDEIQENEAKAENTNAEEKNTTRTDNQPDEGVEYTFPMELLGKLYEYDNIVFKHISSEFEFASIVLRKPHAQILVDCNGNKVLVYQILWRLRKLLPEKDQDTWINDIALECGYDVITISKKYKDDSNMKDEKKDILKELSSLFDEYDTKK